MRRSARTGRAVVVAAVANPWMWACSGDGPQSGDEPLGWNVPIEAREVRQWSREGMDTAPEWSVAEVPDFVAVPDSTVAIIYGNSGEILHRREGQRYVATAGFLPDGRFVLHYGLAAPDSILLHFFDPASGENTEIPAPKGEAGQSLQWTDFVMAIHDGRIVLMGDNLPPGDEPRVGADVWHANASGDFAPVPSNIDAGGRLAGVLGDGTLAISGPLFRADTTIRSAILSVHPVDAGTQPSADRQPEVIAMTATPGDPSRGYTSVAPWGHFSQWTCAVAGDTVWVVPTERPELVAVHRSGDILLRIDWDAGDRTIPPGAHPVWEGAERFPAVAGLTIGTDGLIYAQRWTLRENEPVQGPEWLVFSPHGDLVARIHIPAKWRVLAFGDGRLLVDVLNDGTGLREVRVYEVATSAAPGGGQSGRSWTGSRGATRRNGATDGAGGPPPSDRQYH